MVFHYLFFFPQILKIPLPYIDQVFKRKSPPSSSGVEKGLDASINFTSRGPEKESVGNT